MRRPNSGYLYRRGSVWWLQFQYPRDSGRKAVQRSLKTRDRTHAELLALPLIEAHKRELWLAANRRNGHFLIRPQSDYTYPLGKTVRDDGVEIWGTPESALLLHPDGRREEVRNGPRVLMTQEFDPERPDGFIVWAKHPDQPKVWPVVGESPEPKRPAPRTDPDLKLLEDYLALQPRPTHFVNDARRSWAKFKAFVDHKPLAKCTRDDGRAFVAHLKAQTPPPAPVTIRKWLSHLKAPIAHGLPKHDPAQDIFHKLQGKVQVQTKRLPLTEADMTLFREKALPKIGDDERLLWMMMATTGMRQSECDSLIEEFEEDGIRYWMIGVSDVSAKTETSMRRVPIPDVLIPLLPARTEGRLFKKPMVIVNKNVGRWMERVGITDKRKVTYSLRHRAHDRMRAVSCPRDIQLQIVGHDSRTIHDDYGVGHPVRILKEWIEKISY